MTAKYDDRTLARFWKKVPVGNPNECWEWTAAKTKGYGTFAWSGTRVIPAARMMYEITYKVPIHGLVVCHHCDNPPCVNPDHLFLGTTADNVADKTRKGRTPKGEGHWGAKLSEEDVLKVLNLYESGLCHREVANIMGVSMRCTRDIRDGRRWNWLTKRMPQDGI